MIELIILIVSMVAALLTYEIGTIQKKGTVKASALVSLAFGLPVFLAQANGFTGFQAIPLAAMGASFAGMSSTSMIHSRAGMALSGAVFSGIFLVSSPFFAGNGGGLGISACIAGIISLGIMKLHELLQH